MSPRLLLSHHYKEVFLVSAGIALLLALYVPLRAQHAIACDPEDPECIECVDAALEDKGLEELDEVYSYTATGSLSGTGESIAFEYSMYLDSGSIVFRARTLYSMSGVLVSDFTDVENKAPQFSCTYLTRDADFSYYQHMPRYSTACVWENGPSRLDSNYTTKNAYEYIVDVVNGAWPYGEVPGTYATTRVYEEEISEPSVSGATTVDLQHHLFNVSIPDPKAWTGSEMRVLHAAEVVVNSGGILSNYSYRFNDVLDGSGNLLEDGCSYSVNSGALVYDDTCTIGEDPEDQPAYDDHVEAQEYLENQLFGTGHVLENGVFDSNEICKTKLEDYIEYLQNEVYTEGPEQ